jgi:galactonate dehydratase
MVETVKITRVRTFLVEGIRYNWTFLKIETDSGIHGWGEATNWPGSPMVEAACEFIGQQVVGCDATQIDFLWTKLYRDFNWIGQAGPLMSAISGIDIALWDINGKLLGVPVYQLLGGSYRRRIPLYANYWFLDGDYTPSDYARQARQAVDCGFGALKLDPFAHLHYGCGKDVAVDGALSESQKQLAVDVVAAVAEAVGSGVAIAIESHAFLNGPTAIEMAQRLAELSFNCMWYEEPARPEFPSAIADIRCQIPLPVCVGERLHSRFMLLPILQRQAADFVMPDITRCGGISEMRKMANIAEAFNVPIAPHSPNGPLSTIASAHVMATVPNFFRQEFMLTDVQWRDECLSEPLPIREGFFELPPRPGLGFDVNEDVLREHPGLRTAPPKRIYYV